MSIVVHKTGINKTLGQQSDTITEPVATSLVGHFKPDAGIATGVWQNQVGDKDLRRFNGVSHNNLTPHNWEFDGTDDYLGPTSTGYGGDPLRLSMDDPFTIGVWWFYDNAEDNYILSMGQMDALGMGLWFEESDVGVEFLVENNSFSSSLPLTNHKWYYVALVHHGITGGTAHYSIYINGSFLGSKLIEPSQVFGYGDVRIGAAQDSQGAPGPTWYYTTANSRCGHVHVYEMALNSSHLRQNFLATHKIHSDRIYGPTYQAISG